MTIARRLSAAGETVHGMQSGSSGNGARRPRRCAARAVTLGGAAALLVVAAMAPSASAQPATETSAPRPAIEAPHTGDDHPGLLERRRRDARDLAVAGVLGGSLSPTLDGTVVALPGAAGAAAADPTASAYAEVATTGVDNILTLLVDFGTGDYEDRTWNGPVHGQLDSTTAAAGGSAELQGSAPAHYEELLFGAGRDSLASYLADQSAGRYGVAGTVHGWVSVPYNAAYYGADDCLAADCPDRVAQLAADAVDAFVADFYAHDPTGSLASFLAPYDRRDRYDGDADGDFTEPDGYIDRLLLVLAGQSEDATGNSDLLRGGFGSIGADDVGDTGPATSRSGGHQLGGSGVWVDTFTAVHEDVALGTLVHRYGHDLGLIDLADPGGSAGVDTSVQFWSPMAGGARLASGPGGNRGSAARAHLGATVPDLLAAERLQLGWLSARVVDPTATETLQLTADGQDAEGADAAVVPLGELTHTVTTTTPRTGERAFVAGIGAAATAVLERPLAGDEERVTWWQWTDTEPVFDTVRTQVLVGATWRDIAPAASGRSAWTSRSAPIAAGATALRFVYATDHVTTGAGVVLDDIRVGETVAAGAEDGIPAGWTATGWASGDGAVERSAAAFYLAERRDLSGYDAALQAGAYVADPRRGSASIDRFGYDDGVLVTLWDHRAADNAVSAHPRAGRLLVVDARPEPLLTTAGAPAPLGMQPRDATFGTSWLRGFSVDTYAAVGPEVSADRVRVRAQPPLPTFDDTDPVYADGSHGQPRLPAAGVTMTVTAEDRSSTTLQLAPVAADPE